MPGSSKYIPSGIRKPKAKILIPRLNPEDLVVLQQVEQIRREFGEEGVERFWAMQAALDKEKGKNGQTG